MSQTLNKLKITGSAKDLENFQSFNKGQPEELDFSKAVPEPSIKTRSFKASKWRAQHWGTEQNAIVVEFDNKRKSILYYEFFTKAGYPLRWLESVAELFPEITGEMIYIEENFEFFGKIMIKHGKVKVMYSYNLDTMLNFLWKEKKIKFNRKWDEKKLRKVIEENGLGEFDIDLRILKTFIEN